MATTLHPALISLGLTPEIIAAHVVRVEPPLTDTQITAVMQENKGKPGRMHAKRAAFVAAGLTTAGTPRKRSPNGTRKPRSSKKYAGYYATRAALEGEQITRLKL